MANEVSFNNITLSDHTFICPLDWNNPEGKEKIGVFLRKVTGGTEISTSEPRYVIYLQGGPGFPSPRPTALSGWIKQAISLGFIVLLLDQRGTGNSHSLTSQNLSQYTPQEQAQILTNFRADSIVKDCEFIRKSLNISKWTLLGQSFGGFVSTTYLSFAPESLEAVLITGGIPPVNTSPDDVYRACYKKCIEKNELYYEQFPHDVELVKKIVKYIQNNTVTLPEGGILTPNRFQSIGFSIGMSDGFERIHYLLENAFVKSGFQEDDEEILSLQFLRNISSEGSSFDTNPFYAILHESIYCENGIASQWSAERIKKEFPQFNDTNEDRIFFTGEMVSSSFFDDFFYLRPLKEAAHILQEKNDWSSLYDVSQLSRNTVPVAAAVYEDDAYVAKDISLKTAQLIKGCQTWVTPEYEHNGLRIAGEKIFKKLYDMILENPCK